MNAQAKPHFRRKEPADPAGLGRLRFTAAEAVVADLFIDRPLVTRLAVEYEHRERTGRDAPPDYFHDFLWRIRRRLQSNGIHVQKDGSRGWYLEEADRDYLRSVRAGGPLARDGRIPA